MAKTEFLPTVTAVRMAWAISGRFSIDETSKTMATFAEDDLKRIVELAANSSVDERSYVISAVATVKSSLRSIETVYKGRELNFKENEKLRKAYLENIKESLDFGNKAQDFIKSLPTMTISAAGGVTLGKIFNVPDVALWAIGIGLAALGYLVNLYVVRINRRKTQMQYVLQDYERCLYYEQYLTRIKTIMVGLFLDIERIHMRVFKEYYEPDTSNSTVEKIVDNTIAGVRPTLCKYVHRHMADKKISPELWSKCESGLEAAINKCQYWEG